MADLKKKARMAVDALEAAYPQAVCSLEYKQPHELLIAARLAAQCTDARVNTVTDALFSRYPTLLSFAAADVSDVEELIKTCGLFKTKAKDIVAMCCMIVNEFGGKLPDNMDDLLKLPGVGRKTANLIMGDVYGKPAVVCDTHCIRITYLLGLINSKDAAKAEKQLRTVLPMEKASDFCHRLVLHGRAVCKANRPVCVSCVMSGFCDFRLKNTYDTTT